MLEVPARIWIAACAHQLQRRWHSVDPVVLEDTAGDLWLNTELRKMDPADAVAKWHKPITSGEHR